MTDLDEARLRFLREAETAGRIQHPDIVQVIEAGEDAASCSSRWSSSKAPASRRTRPKGTC